MTPTTASPATATLRGGEWLLQPTSPADVFTPARLTEEQRLIAQTVTDFVHNEVLPALDRLEQKEWGLARDLVKRCGALGLLGVDVAEAYGGVELDKVTSMIVSERMSQAASFGATFGAHANLLVLPLSLFGTEDQKRTLPAAASHRRNRRRLLPERAGLRLRRPRRQDARRPPGGRQLRPQRREDLDHQRRLRRSVHRVRQGDRRQGRALLGVPRRARVHGRVERQGRAQDGAARLVDDAGHPAGRPSARGEPARRGRQGPQDRVQRAELRPVQARRHGRRRRAGRDRRSGPLCGPAQAVRPADCVVRRDQAQARRDGRARLRGRKPRLSHGGHDRHADRSDAAPAGRPVGSARRHSRSTRSRRRSPRWPAARCSTSSSTRTSRFTAATATSATTLPSGTIAIRASTGSSRAPTRSTAC